MHLAIKKVKRLGNLIRFSKYATGFIAGVILLLGIGIIWTWAGRFQTKSLEVYPAAYFSTAENTEETWVNSQNILDRELGVDAKVGDFGLENSASTIKQLTPTTENSTDTTAWQKLRRLFGFALTTAQEEQETSAASTTNTAQEEVSADATTDIEQAPPPSVDEDILSSQQNEKTEPEQEVSQNNTSELTKGQEESAGATAGLFNEDSEESTLVKDENINAKTNEKEKENKLSKKVITLSGFNSLTLEDKLDNEGAEIMDVYLKYSFAALPEPASDNAIIFEIETSDGSRKIVAEHALDKFYSNNMTEGYFMAKVSSVFDDLAGEMLLKEASEIKIHITVFGKNGEFTPVFIDSAWLEFEYRVEIPPEDPPKVKLQKGEYINPAKDSFSADEEPVISFANPKLTLSEIRQKAQKGEIEIIEDKNRVLNLGIYEGAIPNTGDEVDNSSDQAEPSAWLEPEGYISPFDRVKNIIEKNDILSGNTEEPEEINEDSAQSTASSSQIENNTLQEIAPDTTSAASEINTTQSNDILENSADEVSDKKETNVLEEGLQALFILPRATNAQLVQIKEVKAYLNNPQGERSEAEINIERAGDNFEFKIPRGDSFMPGLYTVEVEVYTQDAVITLQQDFSWGVLAVNFNKSVYTGEDKNAYIQMGVLDDMGHTLCNAELELKIKTPANNVSIFHTRDGSIQKSGQCRGDSFTTKPDYYLNYELPQNKGIYQVELTATTANGIKTISDSFEVRDAVLFDIERLGPTRIYPIESYEMRFRIKANQDFTGEIAESVPESFVINSQEGKQILIGDKKRIIWGVDIARGDSVELSYVFDAPNESPQFYLLGPLQVADVFQETRSWQIAGDATLPTLHPAQSDGTNNGCQWTNSGTQSAYQQIDDETDNNETGVADLDTTDYVNNPSAACDIFVNLTDMPTDLENMITLEIEADLATANFLDDNATVFAQIFASDESTNYTDEVQLGTEVSSGFVGPISFTLSGTGEGASEADWNGAKLRLRWTYTINKGDDVGELRVNAVEIEGVYNAEDDFAGPRYAGTAADGANGRACSWTNPTNAQDNDTNTAATCTLTGNNKTTNDLRLTNFGFTAEEIPSGSVIDGVEVEVEWNDGTTITDNLVQLTKNGTTGVGDNNAQSTTQSTKQIRTYGSATNTWNASLTQSDVISSNFGVLLNYIQNSGANNTVNVYRARITVYFTPPVIDVTGVIYESDETTPYDCSSNNLTVAVKVNGAGNYSGVCSASSGAYTATNVDPNSSGDVLTVFLDDETEKATTVTRIANPSANLSGIDLFINHLITRHEDSGPIDNTDLGQFDDASDADIVFDVDASNNLITEDNIELHVWDGDTFTPGGTVETSSSNDGTDSVVDGDVHIDGTGTLEMGSNTLTVGGDFNNEGTFTASTGQQTVFSATSTAHTITDGGENFANVDFNGSGGSWSFADATTINEDLTMSAGELSGTSSITVNGGDVTGNGDINLTGGTFTLDGAGNFGGDSAWTFNNLTFGGAVSETSTATGSGDITINSVLTIQSDQTLNAGSKLWVLSASGTPISRSGTFEASTSTVRYTSGSGVTALSSSAMTGGNAFNILDINGTGTFNVGVAVEVLDNLSVSSGATLAMAANNLTVGSSSITDSGSIDVEGSLTQSASGITTIRSSNAGNASIGGGGTLSFYDLTITPSVAVAPSINLGNAAGQTITVNNNLTIGNGTDPVNVSANTNNPTLNVTGSGTIDAGATLTSGTGTHTFTGGLTIDGTLDGSTSGSIILNSDVVGSGTINLTGGSFEQRVSAASTFGATAGSNNWTFNNLELSNSSGSPVTVEAASGGSGSIIVSNTFTLGPSTDSATTTFDNETNDRILDLSSILIDANGVLSASSSASFTVSGNWTNDGTLNEGTGSIEFDGTSSANIDTGCTAYNNCSNNNFFDIEINKTGASANDDILLINTDINIAGTLTITDGEFVQGALNMQAEGGTAISVASAGQWTNLSTGDIYLDGDIANNGSINLNANGSVCGENDDIIINNVSATPTWSGSGTFIIKDVDIANQHADASITLESSTNSGGNSGNFTFTGCTVLISGKVFQEDETSFIGNPPCDNSTAVVSLRINGGSENTASCTSDNGTYSFSGLTPSAGDVLTIYLNNSSTPKANLILIVDEGDITDADLYQNTVIVRDNQDGTLAISDTLDYDDTNDSTNMLYNSSSGTPDTMTLEDGVELHIWTGDNFTAGGTITTSPSSNSSTNDGDIHIATGGTLGMEANALSIGGDFDNQGTFSKSAGQVTTFTATATGHSIEPNGNNFEDLTFDGSGGGWSFASAGGVDNDLAVTSGTLSGTSNLTVNGTVSGAGIINLTGGTFQQQLFANENFGTTSTSNSWVFNNLMFSNATTTPYTSSVDSGGTGDILINGQLLISDTGDNASTTLNAGNRLWQLAGTGGNPFNTDRASGVLNGQTSTFEFTGNNGTGNTTVEDASYYELIFTGSETYSPEGTVVVASDLTVNSSATLDGSQSITVNGNVAGTGAINITGGAFKQEVSADSTFGTPSGSSNWTFNDLIFSNSDGAATHTIVVDSGGSGDITVNGRLLISETGDSQGITLNAANRSYILANANEQNPFDTDQAGGVLNAQTSTFEYTGDYNSGDVHIEDASYYNLTIGGSVIENYNPTESSITVSNDLTINSNGTLKGTNSIFVNGTAGGAGAIDLTGGVFEQRISLDENFGTTSGTKNWKFNDLKFSNSSGAANRTVTVVSGGLGQIIITGTLDLGPSIDSFGTTLDIETNDRVFDAHHINIDSSGTLTASSTASFSVSGNWINTGTLNEGTGEITFDGSSSATIDTGCADADSCTAENFYDIEVNKPSSTDANDNLTLTNSDLRVSNTITITNGEFVQGTGYIRAEGTTAVSINSGTDAKWTNISTGNLTLGGSFNSGDGTVTFQGGGSGCGDPDLILIRSTVGGTQRSWNDSGAVFNFNDVDVADQGGTSSIEVNSGTDNGGNGANWTFTGCPVPTTPLVLYPSAGNTTAGGDGTDSGVIQEENANSCDTVGIICADSIDDTNGGSVDNDSTFNENDQSETSGTQFYQLTDMPSDFQSMDSLDIEIVWRDLADGNDDLVLSAQVFESNETSALTDQITIHSHNGSDVGYTTTNLSFTLQGNNNKTVWDGARLALDWSYTQNQGQDNLQIRVTNAQLNAAYVSPIEITGNAYEDEATTALVACDGSTNMISANVRGTSFGPVPCNASSGAFTLPSVDRPAAGDKVFLWIDGTTCNDDAVNNSCATTMIVDDGGGDITDAVIRRSRLLLRHDNDGPMANTDLLNWENSDDADIVYDVNDTSFDLITEDGIKIIVNSNDDYQPGAQITTSPSSSVASADGDFEIESGATMNISGNALSIGGDFENAGSLTFSPGQITTFSATATGHTITDGGDDFENVTFNGSGGGWSFADATILNRDLTVSAGTLSGTADITVKGGDITGAGTINLTGGTTTITNCNNSNDINGGTYTFFNLTIGDNDGVAETCLLASDITVGGVLTIDPVSDGINEGFNLATHTLTLSGSGTPLVNNGAFGAATGKVTYTGTSLTNIAALTYYNLESSPAATATHRLGTAGSQAITVNNDLIIGNGTDPVTLDQDNWDPTVDVNNNFIINSGATYSASSARDLSIDRNFTNSGIFTHNSGRIIFESSSPTTLVGPAANTTVFGDFRSATNNKTLRFTSGQTFQIDGFFNISGALGAEININSTDNTTQWFINHQGTDDVTYLNVKNSGCDPASTDIELSDGTSIDGGNNDACWNFVGEPPTVNNPELNNGNNISLVEDTTTAVSAIATASDPDGFNNLSPTATTAVFYRSGVGPSCTPDDNNCYIVTGAGACPMSSCSGNDCIVTCTANIQFFAEPTDTGSDYEGQNWLTDITVKDIQSQSDTGTTLGVDLLTLLALGLSGDIDYGSLAPGDDTGATNQQITIKNTGNTTNNPEVSGVDLIGPDTIAVGNQKFDINAFTYSAAGTALSGIQQSTGISLIKPTSTTPVDDLLYWGLGLPTGLGSGLYQGHNDFYSVE